MFTPGLSDDESVSELEPAIPASGPFYPVPPNLPPPDNVINPLLLPPEMLQWRPSPDFDEDNAVLEEQTNGVETNTFHKRLRYLKVKECTLSSPASFCCCSSCG